MENLFKKVGFIFLLLLISIALVGCKENASVSKEDTNKDQTQKADEVDLKEDLKVAYYAQPPNLDPHSGADIPLRDISQHIFEPLLTLNASLEVEPMLAESYEMSEDGKTLTFHLRQGISFHNGKELTADDVVASMERWQKMNAQAITYLKGTEYEAVDDYTVVANIANPSTVVLYVLADLTQFAAIMPKEITEKAGTEWIEEFIGTGPYEFVDWKHDQYIHVKKYEQYQSRDDQADGLAGEKKAFMQNIYFQFVKDPSTRVAGLQSGEYDLATNVPLDSAEMLENDAEIESFIQATSFPIILFNEKDGIFKDKKARQATNAAINVEEILIATYGNEKYYEKNHALVKKDQTDWYTEAGSEIYNLYDPELAKELLDESGYDGEEVKIITTRDNMDWYNMMVVVQNQLEEVGMNIKLVTSDMASLQEVLDEADQWDLYSSAFAFRPTPIQFLFLNSEWYGWIDSPEISEIQKKILYASSLEEAKTYTADFHQAVWEHLPMITPGDQTTIVSYRKGLTGYQSITGPILWNVSLQK